MLQTQVNQKARMELAERAVATKLRENLSFEQITEGTGLDVVFVTAAILGQHPLPPAAAAKVGEHLGLDQSDIALLQSMPVRGSLGASIPTDPTMYRFYEIAQVYGSTLEGTGAREVRRRHPQRHQFPNEHRKGRGPGRRTPRRDHA